jgi:hypothetical protein
MELRLSAKLRSLSLRQLFVAASVLLAIPKGLPFLLWFSRRERATLALDALTIADIPQRDVAARARIGQHEAALAIG